jgi:3-oxoacyl-(acyl-carrier-protein) synthase
VRSFHDIVITGVGIVSALGWNLEDTWSAIEEGRSGLGPLTLFQSERCGRFPVAEVKNDMKLKGGLTTGSRSDHLAVWAARTAFEGAGFGEVPREERRNIGVIIGATTGGMLDTESFLLQMINEGKVDARLLARHECAHATNAVAKRLGLGGFRSTVSTACSSGAMAISMACDVLSMGDASTMLAGGVDTLTRLTLNGFASLLIIAADGCRPFDANRSGMSLGEGAAVLVLEKEESAKKRGTPVLARLAGWASACDAHHMTAPVPDGSGIYRAMLLALERAAIKRSAVSYVNAHGTGTVDNDIAEARAISRLFGDNPPLVSSTKRFFGHTLAAAGALEAVV